MYLLHCFYYVKECDEKSDEEITGTFTKIEEILDLVKDNYFLKNSLKVNNKLMEKNSPLNHNDEFFLDLNL